MPLHKRKQDKNVILVGEGEARQKFRVDVMDAAERAAETLKGLRAQGVRPMQWPSKEVERLQKVETRHQSYADALMLTAYAALDLGMVDEALLKFNTLARIPAAKSTHPVACGEMAFILGGFYGEGQSASDWKDLYENRSDVAVSLGLSWRLRCVVDGDSAAAGFLNSWKGERGFANAQAEWLEKVESGEWEEEWDDKITDFGKGRILRPPFY